jgi:hypothetical protein
MKIDDEELLARLDELAAEERGLLPPAHLRQRILGELAPAPGRPGRWWRGGGHRPWLAAAVVVLMAGFGATLWRWRDLTDQPITVARSPVVPPIMPLVKVAESTAPVLPEPADPRSMAPSPSLNEVGDDPEGIGEEDPLLADYLANGEFEYLLYLEVPSSDFQSDFSEDSATIGADQPHVSGTGYARVLIGDDGMVQAIQIRDRQTVTRTIY